MSMSTRQPKEAAKNVEGVADTVAQYHPQGFKYFMAKKAWYTVAGCLSLIVSFAVLLFGVGVVLILFSVMSEEETTEEIGDIDIDASDLAEDEIPAEYIPIYEEAGEEYGVPWTLLAALHRVETEFSTMGDGEEDLVSPVGAEGHIQFMPCSWVGWGHSSCGGLGAGDIPEDELTDLDAIDDHGGFAVDGSGDGEADPYDIEDAVHSAANYIAEQGAADGDLEEAVFAYNGADWYVDDVMGYMEAYTDGGAEAVEMDGGDGVEAGPEVAEDAIDEGKELVGDTPYVWGGGRTANSRSNHEFDCSSFVHYIFDENGVELGDYQSVTTDSLVQAGESVDEDDMQRGDLVFFDTYKENGHVGLYLGDGEYLGSQSSTGVEVESMDDGYWEDTFNGNIRRVAG